MQMKICIISLSQIAQDGRVLRQIEFLSRKYRVLVVGYGNPPINYTNQTNIEWIALPWSSRIWGLLRRLFERLLIIPFFPKLHPVFKILKNSNCDVIHVNNWDSLPMAAEAVKEQKTKIVFDIHESYNSWYWGVTTPIISFVLRKYSRFVNTSTTVVDALSVQHEKFGLKPIVIMNAPDITTISEDKPIIGTINLIHHGTADPSRHLETMIRTIALCDSRYSLSFMLMPFQSRYTKYLKRIADEIAPGRVTFLEPVTPAKINDVISRFDIGFYPLKPVNFNQRIALPNKFFDFLTAGLAVCIGPSPSMAELVKKYNCGVVASSFTPRDLSYIVNNTTEEQWTEMKSASRIAARELNANVEMGKVMEIYKRLLPTN